MSFHCPSHCVGCCRFFDVKQSVAAAVARNHLQLLRGSHFPQFLLTEQALQMTGGKLLPQLQFDLAVQLASPVLLCSQINQALIQNLLFLIFSENRF